uniref:Vacuolar protein sorting-associated protein 53 homolog n=1 Tax=Heterorhabditis bacteriophora TaxID=37862 RepID=A0A1I7WB50_HETBA
MLHLIIPENSHPLYDCDINIDEFHELLERLPQWSASNAKNVDYCSSLVREQVVSLNINIDEFHRVARETASVVGVATRKMSTIALH